MIDAVAIFEAAQETFDQRCGSCGGLVPGTPRLTATCKTWKQVWARVTHATAIWNEKYGPLNHKQRDYATSLILHALQEGAKAPSPQQHYAFYNQELTKLLNHERVDEGFKTRRDSGDMLGDLVGDFAEVTA